MAASFSVLSSASVTVLLRHPCSLGHRFSEAHRALDTHRTPPLDSHSLRPGRCHVSVSDQRSGAGLPGAALAPEPAPSAPRERAEQTPRLAEWIHSIRWEALPDTVRERALWCLLDLTGAALAGSRSRVAQIAAAYAHAAHGPGT